MSSIADRKPSPHRNASVPIDLDAFKGCNSVQILHALQLEKKREYAMLDHVTASALEKSRTVGAGLNALCAAGGAGKTLNAIHSLQTSLPHDGPTPQLVGAQVSPTTTSDRHGTSCIPLCQQVVVSKRVIEAVYGEIQQRHEAAKASENARADLIVPRDCASPERSHSPSERQRQLQKQAWKKIGYGKHPQQRTGSPSPERHEGDKEAPPRTFSPACNKGRGLLGDSMASLQRSSSFSSSVASPIRAASRGSARFFEGSFTGSTRRSRSFFRDMPSAEDVQAAFDATTKRLAMIPLRRCPGLCCPIPQRSSALHSNGQQDIDDQQDVQYAMRRTTVGQELDAMLSNSVLACCVAANVSLFDHPLQKILRTVLPHFQQPAVSPSQNGGQMVLRSFGCEGPLRWAALSFDHLPRSTVTVSVASDAVCEGFVEYPGSGRAGAARYSPVVLGSRIENLHHDALHVMCLEGMLGLESIGRAVLAFHGPQLLEREFLCFSETMLRSTLQRECHVELFHTIGEELRRIKSQRKRRAAGLGASAQLRQSQELLQPAKEGSHVPTNAAYTAFIRGTVDALAASLSRRRQTQWMERLFKVWSERGKLSLERDQLQESVVALSLQMMAKRQRVQAFSVRVRNQNTRSVLHVFLVGCMRRKQRRHLDALRLMEERMHQQDKCRREVMVATAVKEPAAHLAAALATFASAQLRQPTGSAPLPLPITLTGHSTGGAIALLAACLINANDDGLLCVRRVITFGAPKVFVEDPTTVLLSLGVINVAVAMEQDPAVHQPWTFDATGTGCFVALPGGDAEKNIAPSASMVARSVRPCPWSELRPTPSAARSHWLSFHSLDTYLKCFAPAAHGALAAESDSGRGRDSLKSKKNAAHIDVEIARREDALAFEAQVLHPSPVRGASHGFSVSAMRCLQHIATRYGVGNQQRVPRDLLLAVLGSAPMKQFSIHLTAERVPVGHGGRIDQATFALWLWSETVIEPRFLAALLQAFHYEYNGRDFYPTQKVLISPPPPPKILPVSVLCQSDGELTFTTIGRGAVESLFRTYSRQFAPSPLEARLAADTPLMSRWCIEQVLQLGGWAHRCSPADAVGCVFQWVTQEHQNALTGKRVQRSIHDRLSTCGKSGKGDEGHTLPLMSYSGEVTERGFQRFMQIFVRLFGLTPLQCALWRLGYNRQWEVVVSRVTSIECDIHWTFGPCKCLAMIAERRAVNAEEEAYLRHEVSVLAAEISSRRKSNGGQHQLSFIPAICDAVSSSGSSTHPSPTHLASRQQSYQPDPLSQIVSDDVHVDALAIRPPTANEQWAMSEENRYSGDPMGGTNATRWSAPVLGQSAAQREQFSATMYSVDEEIKGQWSASGNGRRLQKESRLLARTFVEELRSRSGTSVGSKPRRHLSREQRRSVQQSMRPPTTNTSSTLNAMYAPSNTLRLLNPSQRKILHLPPLRNQLLEGPLGTGDPVLVDEQ